MHKIMSFKEYVSQVVHRKERGWERASQDEGGGVGVLSKSDFFFDEFARIPAWLEIRNEVKPDTGYPA